MLPQLHSERQLSAIEAASVPHLGPSDQQRIIAAHHRNTRGNTATHRSAAEALSQIPIRRVSVPTKR